MSSNALLRRDFCCELNSIYDVCIYSVYSVVVITVVCVEATVGVFHAGTRRSGWRFSRREAAQPSPGCYSDLRLCVTLLVFHARQGSLERRSVDSHFEVGT